ncbi:hypothetical protein VDTJJZMW_CDS_0193 [Pseudomonas phage LPS-5]
MIANSRLRLQSSINILVRKTIYAPLAVGLLSILHWIMSILVVGIQAKELPLLSLPGTNIVYRVRVL